ncbi:MAG: DUF5110 domain-containing protein [Verrucomicrobia bacterium]|nr:DUF5110 domain-containing protein [Verrucomicrobiota bacterium]MCH8526752.1 glycoside hydrolase family 31 protein [Kiritimatiellia bacterium]
MHRLTAYSDSLIRFQFHPKGHFDDRPSFIARHRDHGRVLTPGADGIYRTDSVEIRVKGRGPFTTENTEVHFDMGVWRPGMAPFGSLGGTTRTLDGTAGDPPTTPGILSRDGWALVDDSGTVRFPDSSLDTRHSSLPNTRHSSFVIQPGVPDGQDFYLFLHGHDFQAALADFIKLSGRPPLPPRAVLGMWWSRYWRYRDQDLKNIVAEFRAHDFPLDVLVLDMDWHLAKDWSGYTWNKDLFPDPPAFLDWCHSEGLKTTLNLHPSNGVQAFDEDYTDFAKALGHPADGTRVNFRCSDPAYVEQYFRRLHHPREDEGVDFWWMDWQQGDVCEMPGLDPLAWLNHLHHVDHDRSDRRGVMLSRWGGLGGHRYPIQFSGDTHTKWETLASQVDFTANSAASLAGWWSHDIGGHMQPTPPELFTRWVQWGAWSPALRLHSSNNPNHERRPWAYGPEVETACRVAVEMRLRYFPVWIAVGHRFTETGIAPLTPMWFAHPADPAAHAAQHQAMLGGDLLIAPIVAPMTDGHAERLIYLPPGAWYDIQTGTKHEGGTFIVVEGDLNRVPVFAREGAVLPIDPRPRGAIADLDPSEVHFECWPGSGEGTAIEDAGEGDGWRRGEIARTRLQQVRTGDEVTLTLHGTEGRFPGLPARRTTHIHLKNCGKPERVEGPEGMTTTHSGTDLHLVLPPQLVSEGAEIRLCAPVASSRHTPVAITEPRTELSPRYDLRKARVSLADLVLLPPADGAEAVVSWTAQQVHTDRITQSTGLISKPAVMPCPFAWNEEAGAIRWEAEVNWTWGPHERTDKSACAWDLFTGLGEWDIALLKTPDAAAVTDLDPDAPVAEASEWFPQRYRDLREESLLDGPRLWCDSKLAYRLGRSIGMFAPDGKLQADALKEELIHVAAVTEVETAEPLRVKFMAKALTETLSLAIDGQEIPVDETHYTPVIRHSTLVIRHSTLVIRHSTLAPVRPFWSPCWSSVCCWCWCWVWW